MLLLPCPFCGPRSETEFTCFGELVPPRPVDPDALSDSDWADYVVLRRNLRGIQRERWWHGRGCGSWLVVQRDTVTHQIGAPVCSPEDAQ